LPVYHIMREYVNNKNTRYCVFCITICIKFSIYCFSQVKQNRRFSTGKPPQTLDLSGFAGVFTEGETTFTGVFVLWLQLWLATICCGVSTGSIPSQRRNVGGGVPDAPHKNRDRQGLSLYVPYYSLLNSARRARIAASAAAGSVWARDTCSIGQYPSPARLRMAGTRVSQVAGTPWAVSRS